MSKTIYDFLIVGSGAGGGAALSRLCELWRNQSSIQIGMLEKGDKLFHSNVLNIPTVNERILYSRMYPDNSTPIGERLPQMPAATQVYALGGKTMFWNGTSVRPPVYELEKWPIHLRELDVYFSIAERSMNVTTSYSKGSSLQNVILNRLYANGFLEATDLPLAFDTGESRFGQIHSNPWYSSINDLAKAQFYRPFDLGLNAYVPRIIIENNSVAGVEVLTPDHESHIVYARNVIIAASALEAPRILLNSEIEGNSIGRYLTNHMLVFSNGRISRNKFSEVLGSLSVLLPESIDKPYQIQFSGPNPYFSYPQFQEKLLMEELEISETIFGRVESQADNRVTLDTSALDEYGIPMIQVHYSRTNQDEKVGNQMREAFQKSMAAIEAIPDNVLPPILPNGSDNHESCTCRMGLDPATSVVDPNSKVHGIAGLYIAGNSVLPTLSSANPTLGTVALAIRLADHLTLQA